MDDTTTDIVTNSDYDLRCIESPYGVKGDFNSNAADNLMVTFERCDRTVKTTCKDESVIEEALAFSYILMVENKESYKHQFAPTSSQMIKSETQIGWYAVNTSQRTDFVRKIKTTDVFYNYRNLGLGLWEE